MNMSKAFVSSNYETEQNILSFEFFISSWLILQYEMFWKT